jgi:hypothetical protein
VKHAKTYYSLCLEISVQDRDTQGHLFPKRGSF